MEQALRNRLTYGPIMLAGLFLLLWVDHAAQQWTVGAYTYRGEPQGLAGLGLLALLLIALPGAVTELATLFAAERVRPYRTIAAFGSGAMLLHAFATQFPEFREESAPVLALIVVFVMLGAAIARAFE